MDEVELTNRTAPAGCLGSATAKKFPGALREAFENPILRAAEKQGTDTLDAPNEVSTKMCKHLE